MRAKQNYQLSFKCLTITQQSTAVLDVENKKNDFQLEGYNLEPVSLLTCTANSGLTCCGIYYVDR